MQSGYYDIPADVKGDLDDTLEDIQIAKIWNTYGEWAVYRTGFMDENGYSMGIGDAITAPAFELISIHDTKEEAEAAYKEINRRARLEARRKKTDSRDLYDFGNIRHDESKPWFTDFFAREETNNMTHAEMLRDLLSGEVTCTAFRQSDVYGE